MIFAHIRWPAPSLQVRNVKSPKEDWHSWDELTRFQQESLHPLESRNKPIVQSFASASEHADGGPMTASEVARAKHAQLELPKDTNRRPKKSKKPRDSTAGDDMEENRKSNIPPKQRARSPDVGSTEGAPTLTAKVSSAQLNQSSLTIPATYNRIWCCLFLTLQPAAASRAPTRGTRAKS